MCSERDVADELFTHHLAPEQNDSHNEVATEVTNEVEDEVEAEVQNTIQNTVPNEVDPHNTEDLSDQASAGTDFKYTF